MPGYRQAPSSCIRIMKCNTEVRGPDFNRVIECACRQSHSSFTAVLGASGFRTVTPNSTRVSRRKRDAFRVLSFLVLLVRYDKRSAFPSEEIWAENIRR